MPPGQALTLGSGAGIFPPGRSRHRSWDPTPGQALALGAGAGISPLVRPLLSAQELGSHPQSGNHEQSLHAATKGQHSQ